MASRQVMRSVSADFCADAGAIIASTMPTAGNAPRSQVSNRIEKGPFDGKARPDKTTPAPEAPPGPTRGPRVPDAAMASSELIGRNQPSRQNWRGWKGLIGA